MLHKGPAAVVPLALACSLRALRQAMQHPALWYLALSLALRILSRLERHGEHSMGMGMVMVVGMGFGKWQREGALCSKRFPTLLLACSRTPSKFHMYSHGLNFPMKKRKRMGRISTRDSRRIAHTHTASFFRFFLLHESAPRVDAPENITPFIMRSRDTLICYKENI